MGVLVHCLVRREAGGSRSGTLPGSSFTYHGTLVAHGVVKNALPAAVDLVDEVLSLPARDAALVHTPIYRFASVDYPAAPFFLILTMKLGGHFVVHLKP